MATAAQIQTTDPHITTDYFDQSVYLNIKLLLQQIQQAASTELASLTQKLRAGIALADNTGYVSNVFASGSVKLNAPPLDAYAISKGAPAIQKGAWAALMNSKVPAGKYSATVMQPGALPMLVNQLQMELNRVHLPTPPQLQTWLGQIMSFMSQTPPNPTITATSTGVQHLRNRDVTHTYTHSWPNALYYAMLYDAYQAFESLYNWVPSLVKKVTEQQTQAAAVQAAAQKAASAQATAQATPTPATTQKAVTATTQAVQQVKQAAAKVAANNGQAPSGAPVTIAPAPATPSTPSTPSTPAKAPTSKTPLYIAAGLIAAKALGLSL